MKRRTALKGIALLTGLAGCVGNQGGDGGGSSPTDASTATATDTATPTPTETTETVTVGGTTPGNMTQSIEAASLPEHGADEYVEQVETFEAQGAKHVEAGSEVDYAQVPPTSGPHYSTTIRPGFYEEQPPLGALVHNLEHGAVVIYYDPTAITDEARESLRAFAKAHTDPWAHVVVVPSPREDPKAPYVLTAWRKMLRLKSYDPQAVRAFLAEYVGRGPENPVR